MAVGSHIMNNITDWFKPKFDNEHQYEARLADLEPPFISLAHSYSDRGYPVKPIRFPVCGENSTLVVELL